MNDRKELIERLRTDADYHQGSACQCPYCKIDELRAENARLKAELGDLPQAQAEMLSECKRLREAIKPAIAAMLRVNVDCRIFHHDKCDEHHFTDVCKPSIRFEVALHSLRAALGIK